MIIITETVMEPCEPTYMYEIYETGL